MNELSQFRPHRSLLRTRLMMAAAAAALLAAVGTTSEAEASKGDGDQPVVWIELGGQFDQLAHSTTGWSPPDLTPPISNPSPPPFGRAPLLGYDGWLKLSLEPSDSDWTLAFSLRYGRAKLGPKIYHDQSYVLKTSNVVIPPKYILSQYNFANSTEKIMVQPHDYGFHC